MHVQMIVNSSGVLNDFDNVVLLTSGYISDHGKPRKAWRLCFADRPDLYLPMRENSIYSVDTQIPIEE